jgi:nucleotide-binding universal stress UspA family protein
VPKILLAVDGSESALRATRSLITAAQWLKESPQVELVTVHLAVPQVGGFAGSVINQDALGQYYSQEGEKMLAAARRLLDEAKITYTPHVLVGDIAHSIVEHGQKTGCDLLYLGTRGMSGISKLVLGSVATKVLHLAQMPVVVVH